MHQWLVKVLVPNSNVQAILYTQEAKNALDAISMTMNEHHQLFGTGASFSYNLVYVARKDHQ